MLTSLILECRNANYIHSGLCDFSDEYGKTKVYEVEADDMVLTYWNSSNDEKIPHQLALELIGDELYKNDSICQGSVSVNMNEIMFEINEH